MARRQGGALGRRTLLRTAALATAGMALGARLGRADQPAAQQAMARILEGRTAAAAGGITLDLPRIAENGNSVPLTVSVDSPMSEDDHVTAIHLFADSNPNPEVVTFHLMPDSGKASVATRMRLARSQTVHALAELSDGRVLRAAQEVTVTIGGCGA